MTKAQLKALESANQIRGLSIKAAAYDKLLPVYQELLAASKKAILVLNYMTTERFSRGADKPTREALVQALAHAAQLDEEISPCIKQS